MKVFWFLPLVFGFSPTYASTSIDETINVSSAYSMSIEVQAGSYIQGSILSDAPLNSAAIWDAKGNLIKSIVDTNQRDGRLFWSVDKDGKYFLKIVPIKTSSNVHVIMDEKKLKNDQTVNPKEAIISPQLIDIAETKAERREAEIVKFWLEMEKEGTPLIEVQKDGSALVTFLWRGNESNVRLFGAPYDGHVYLSNLEGSDIWYKSYRVPNGTRLSYRLAPNVPQLSEFSGYDQRRAVLATSQIDPLNIHPTFGSSDDKFGKASTLEYGDVPSDRFTRDLGALVGNMSAHTVTSKTLGNSRSVKVYQPNSHYPILPNSPLLLIFDGDQYLTRVPTPIILDNLIAENKIPPLRAVFINNPTSESRAEELPPNPNFAHFMANELMPWLVEEFDLSPQTEQTILTGSSYGGLASMYIAHQYPHIFGNVLSQSGSFWWADSTQQKEWLTKQIAQSPQRSLKIYMNAGVFEQKPEQVNIIDTNRKLYNVLTEQQYDVKFDELASGHDYYSWRVTIANGLDYLFEE